MTEAMGKMLFEKQSGATELFNEEGTLSESGFLTYRLNRMIEEGHINEAENILFDTIEDDPKQEYWKVALDFYATLEKRSDAELLASNFSRQEIVDGLQEVKKIYGM